MPAAIVAAIAATPLIGAIGMGGAIAAANALVALGISVALSVGAALLTNALYRPGNTRTTQPKPQDFQNIIRAATADRWRSYGRVKVGGVLAFAESSDRRYIRIVAMGSGRIDAVEQHWIDDLLVTIDANGRVTAPSKFTDFGTEIWIQGNFLGSTSATQTVTRANSLFGSLWTSSHVGRGVPWAMVELRAPNEDNINRFNRKFPRGAETQYRQVQRAARVPTPATLNNPGSWTWSANAARVIMDYLIHPDGMGLEKSWIENGLEHWEKAVNDCNDSIPRAGGGSEPRYQAHGTYTFAERPADVLSRFMAACDGVLVPTYGASGPGIGLKVGKWEIPTVTLGADAIVAFSEIGRGQDVFSTANIIRATFSSPQNDYQGTDADPWEDVADIAARGELPIDVELLTVQSHAQARRLMKIAARRAAPAWTGTITTNLRGLPVIGERFINVSIPDLALSDTFEVLDVQMIVDEGAALTGLNIQIASLRSEAYSWTPSQEEGNGPPDMSEPGIDPELPVPTGLDLEFDEQTIGGETGIVAILSWDAAVGPGSPPEDITYDARGKRTDSEFWFSLEVDEGGPEATSHILEEDVEYEFQVRTRSLVTGLVSSWTASETGTATL